LSTQGKPQLNVEQNPDFVADIFEIGGGDNIPVEPPVGQRCSGRNYEGRRCCTPENPCNEGEGDCDGPLDGGRNDGHAGCKGDLVCGSNNCKKFGHYYHEKDDCCEQPSIEFIQQELEETQAQYPGGLPVEPPAGQRCSGRNYQGRRCCTPENPCDEGEGDCDGPGDGGLHDGNAGCKGDLVCGSNNCRKFGLYYHDKDDCCERPDFDYGGLRTQPLEQGGWGPWSEGACFRREDGTCKKTRTRNCTGPSCPRTKQSQDRPCVCI